MKKNRLLRAATVLLVLTLITSCFVGGTFAKYTTSADSQDTARVATWGFNQMAVIDLSNLFKTQYDNANILGAADVIAPGSTNSATFNFVYSGATATPEVAYTFTVSTDDSAIADDIKGNKNIEWGLTKGDRATTWFANNDPTNPSWNQMIAAIEKLSGDDSGSKQYAPGELPTAFSSTADTYTVAWRWVFSTAEAGDTADTAMGNKNPLDAVTLKITVTATQID